MHPPPVALVLYRQRAQHRAACNPSSCGVSVLLCVGTWCTTGDGRQAGRQAGKRHCFQAFLLMPNSARAGVSAQAGQVAHTHERAPYSPTAQCTGDLPPTSVCHVQHVQDVDSLPPTPAAVTAERALRGVGTQLLRPMSCGSLPTSHPSRHGDLLCKLQ